MDSATEVRYAGVVVGRAVPLRDRDDAGLFLLFGEPLPVGTPVWLKIEDAERTARVTEVVESADPNLAGMRLRFGAEQEGSRSSPRPMARAAAPAAAAAPVAAAPVPAAAPVSAAPVVAAPVAAAPVAAALVAPAPVAGADVEAAPAPAEAHDGEAAPAGEAGAHADPPAGSAVPSAVEGDGGSTGGSGKRRRRRR